MAMIKIVLRFEIKEIEHKRKSKMLGVFLLLDVTLLLKNAETGELKSVLSACEGIVPGNIYVIDRARNNRRSASQA